MREKDLVAGSALVSGYARKGCGEEARKVFGRIEGVVNVVTWNGMVAGFNQSGRCLEAVEVFKEMCVEMLRVFDEMGCNDVGACNALISGFARNGLTDEALEAFKRLRNQEPELNVVSWTSIIAISNNV